MKGFIAVAAMSLNRAIGKDGKIPWHLPEDFKWFKRLTTGHIILMGRKTFDSLGRKLLPGRTSMVVSRKEADIPGVIVVRDLEALDPAQFEQTVFVIGGAQIYAELLPRCSDLYLTVVKREAGGDAFFPDFEHQFNLVGIVLENPEFEVRHYRSNAREFAEQEA
jgi:dihydrofolate reductase